MGIALGDLNKETLIGMLAEKDKLNDGLQAIIFKQKEYSNQLELEIERLKYESPKSSVWPGEVTSNTLWNYLSQLTAEREKNARVMEALEELVQFNHQYFHLKLPVIERAKAALQQSGSSTTNKS